MADERYPDGDQFAGHNFHSTVATMVAASAGMADGDQSHTGARLTAGDGFGSDYTYHASGRPAVATGDGRGGFVHDGSGTDDWFSLQDQSIANAGEFGAIGDNSPSNGAVNSTAFNAAIAAFVALNDSEGGTIPQVVESVVVPPGDYYIDSTLECDCTNNPNLVLRGSGRDITRIIASDAIGSTPVFQFTNTTANGSQRCEFGTIEELTFLGTQPSAGQPDDVLSLGAMNHMVLKKVRVLGGLISGVNVGYCISTSFVDCLFQASKRFGMRCTVNIFNDVSFRGTGFLANEVCGFYTAHPGSRNLNFFGCAFELNESLGAYFMEVNGLAMHGCYFEKNGATAPHTFLTRANGAILGGNWDVRGDVCLAGRTTTGLDNDNLPTDTGEVGSETVSMQGNAWSPDAVDQRHVILAGVTSADIQQPAGPVSQPWADSQNGRTLWKNVRLTGLQDHPGPHISYAAASMDTTAVSIGGVDGNRFSWVPNKLVEMDLGRGADTGNSTWNPVMLFPGATAYDMSDTVAGNGDFNNLTQRMVYDEFVDQQCVLELFAYFMTSSTTTNYNCGLVINVTDKGGSKTSASAAAPLNPDDAVTTGTVSALSTALVVADATGIAGGDPIVVKGAGVAGVDLATVVAAITGTAVTLRDQATTLATDAEVRVPRLTRIRMNIEPAAANADGKSLLQVRRFGGAANDSVWIDRITLRVVGSDENMQPFQDPRVLRSVGSPETVVSGGVGYQCIDIAGAVGSVLYLKESGTGKTGWKKLVGA